MSATRSAASFDVVTHSFFSNPPCDRRTPTPTPPPTPADRTRVVWSRAQTQIVTLLAVLFVGQVTAAALYVLGG